MLTRSEPEESKLHVPNNFKALDPSYQILSKSFKLYMRWNTRTDRQQQLFPTIWDHFMLFCSEITPDWIVLSILQYVMTIPSAPFRLNLQKVGAEQTKQLKQSRKVTYKQRFENMRIWKRYK